ncbi:MAG: TadE/TadG family type IV pilus assembly protein [Pseudomonadota bacterium]
MIATFRNFLKSKKGVVSIEFSLIFPVFVFFMLGSLGTWDHYRAKRHSVMAVDTVADLVARTNNMNNAERDLIFASAAVMMDRYADASSLAIGIHSVQDDGGGNIEVLWSQANNGTHSRSVGSFVTDVTFPPIPQGETAILAELSFDYRSPVLYFVNADVPFEQFSIRRPRYVSVIGYQ